MSKFRRSIYVDDLTTGSHDADSAYEFYIKSNMRLAEASFNLRKFDTKSTELRQRIEHNEGLLSKEHDEAMSLVIQTRNDKSSESSGM